MIAIFRIAPKSVQWYLGLQFFALIIMIATYLWIGNIGEIIGQFLVVGLAMGILGRSVACWFISLAFTILSIAGISLFLLVIGLLVAAYDDGKTEFVALAGVCYAFLVPQLYLLLRKSMRTYVREDFDIETKK